MAVALIVEDDKSSLEPLSEWVAAQGFEVRTASDIDRARSIIHDEPLDLVLLDLQLPDGSGLDLLPALEDQPAAKIVFVTGHGTIDSAVEAVRGGAVDYLTKPIDLERLQKIVAQLKDTLELRRELADLRGELRALGRFGPLVGSSAAMQPVYDLIGKVAPTSSTVLIQGETGTGKELVARAVHELSRRAKKPLLAVNCGAIQSTLVESELFGHEKGSFTGADRQHKGMFERAHGGTLFLDEITEMPLDLQVKLLRVLENGTLQRVGGDRQIEVDVRLLAATNRDPMAAVKDERLREDLLYRLNVFPIALPPLREREEDVLLLADFFTQRLNRENETRKTWSDAARRRLTQHAWPGNVRELKNLVERAFILTPGKEIQPECVRHEGLPPVDADAVGPGSGPEEALGIRSGMTIKDAERVLIESTLERCDGDKKAAARSLGISLKTLYNRLAAYGGG